MGGTLAAGGFGPVKDISRIRVVLWRASGTVDVPGLRRASLRTEFRIAEGVMGVENISKVRMVLRRAYGTATASRLRQGIFWKEFSVAEGLDG